MTLTPCPPSAYETERRAAKEDQMICMKVQFDAYNRIFKLIDRDMGGLLEDGAIYDLSIPFGLQDTEEQECFTSFETMIAHA